MITGARVFILEDEALIALELTDRLSALGYEIVGRAASGEVALGLIEKLCPDIALVDIHLAGKLDGIATASRIREHHDVAVIFLTAYSSAEFLRRAGDAGSFGYLVKPFDERVVHSTIQMALYRRKLEQSLRGINLQLEERVRTRTLELEVAAKRLADSEAELIGIWNTTTEAIRLSDESGRVRRVNPAFCALFGVAAKAMIGQPMYLTYMPGREAEYLVEHQKRFSEPARSGFIETTLNLRDGRTIWVEVYHRVLPVDAEDSPLLLTVFRDITERKLAVAALASSEARFAALFRSGPIATCLSDLASGEILDVNDRLLKLFEKSREAMLRERVRDASLWGDSSEARIQLIDCLERCGRILDFERNIFLSAEKTIDVTVAVHRVEVVGRQCLLSTFVDITNRKAAEREIRRLNSSLESLVQQRTETLALSEERFRRLAENMRDLLCMIDEGGRFAYVSPSFNTVLDYPADVLLGASFAEFVHEEDRASVSVGLRRVIEEGVAQNQEFRFLRHGGRFVWLEAVGSSVRNPNGEVKGCVLTARDVSERKEAAQRLQASEHRYAHLVENVHDAIIRDDASGRIIFANRRFREWFGYLDRELVEVTVEDHAAPEWRDVLSERHSKRMRGEDVPDRFEYEGIRGDGSKVWLDVFVSIVCESGRIVGTQSVIRDITARKQAELASQAVLNRTSRVLGDEYFRTLAFELGRAFDVNIVCIAQLQDSGLLKPLAHYADGTMLETGDFVPAAWHQIQQVLQRGEPVLVERGLSSALSSEVWGRLNLESFYGLPIRGGGQAVLGILIMASTRPLRLEPLQLSLLNILALRAEAEFVRNETEAEKAALQATLFQGQKNDALGRLAGGVAHDFNNILTGVMNYTTLARADVPVTFPQVKEYLTQVLNCGNRAKQLVRQILLFSRSEQAERVPLLLQKVVAEAFKLLRSTIPASVEMISEIDGDAPVVLANSTEIHQVVMNLGINAAHAMRSRGGVLRIQLSTRILDEVEVRECVGLKAGPHISLVVADSGVGMEPAVLARIFEPFFTTKEVGEGTGLGLAVVHSVVRSHQGSISVSSVPGKGSRFEILFPVHASGVMSIGSSEPSFPSGRGESIMVVDDEITIALSVKLLLERIGYRVTTFNHPEQALASFWTAPSDYDLLITDFQMPSMSGAELAKRILSHRPGFPIFLASGYANNFRGDEMSRLGIVGYFQKPLDLPEVARLLDGFFRGQKRDR